MITEEQWQLAKEEFGEEAWKRVKVDFRWVIEYNFSSTGNYTVDCAVVNEIKGLVKYKPVTELIAHDKEFYGKNAFLIWEKSTTWRDCYRDHEQTSAPWLNLASNSGLYVDQYTQLRRKTSAALPFDLDRAKAGDVVEILCFRPNDDLTQPDIHEVIPAKELVDAYIEGDTILFNNDSLEAEIKHLRMKYPPKASHVHRKTEAL